MMVQKRSGTRTGKRQGNGKEREGMLMNLLRCRSSDPAMNCKEAVVPVLVVAPVSLNPHAAVVGRRRR